MEAEGNRDVVAVEAKVGWKNTDGKNWWKVVSSSLKSF